MKKDQDNNTKKTKRKGAKSRWVQKRLFTFKVKGQDRHLSHLTRTYRELFRFSQLAENPPKEFIFPKVMDSVDSEDSLRNIHTVVTNIVEKFNEKTGEKDKKIVKKREKDIHPDKKFREFWELNKELFIEPIDDTIPVEIVAKPITDISDQDTLYLKIDLMDTDSALFHAQSIIETHRRDFKFESKAEFKISTHQKFIRLEKLLAYRIAYIHRQQHLDIEHRKDTPKRQETFDYLLELDLIKPIKLKYKHVKIEKPSDRFKKENRDLEQEKRKISFFCQRTKEIINGIEADKFTFP
jgi:hypothetical protein